MKLKYTSDEEPGFTRRRWGKGFTYLDPEGTRLPKGEHRKRIEALVIPPAYESVWICIDPMGHLQATGRDQRKRKQYRYHEEWSRIRNEKKFASLLPFAAQLPQLRREINLHVKESRMTADHVAALVLKIIDTTGARIGNARYREENGTHGISTLTKEHIEPHPKSLDLSYIGKHGKSISLQIENPRIRRAIMRCHELPGEELFQYRGEDQELHSLESVEINNLLHKLAGDEFSAKTFRTWRGSVLAFNHLKDQVAEESRRKRKSQEMAAIRATAAELHNTVSTCRNYYIHPFLLKSWMDGSFGEHLAAARRSRAFRDMTDDDEQLLAKFLKQE